MLSRDADAHLTKRGGGVAAKAHWHVCAIAIVKSLPVKIDAVDDQESGGS